MGASPNEHSHLERSTGRSPQPTRQNSPHPLFRIARQNSSRDTLHPAIHRPYTHPPTHARPPFCASPLSPLLSRAAHRRMRKELRRPFVARSGDLPSTLPPLLPPPRMACGATSSSRPSAAASRASCSSGSRGRSQAGLSIRWPPSSWEATPGAPGSTASSSG